MVTLTKCSCLGSGRKRAGCHTCSIQKQEYFLLMRQRPLPAPWHAPPHTVLWQKALQRSQSTHPAWAPLWVQPLTEERRHPKGALGLTSCLEKRGWYWLWWDERVRHCPFLLGLSQSKGIQPTCKVLLCKLPTKQDPLTLPSSCFPSIREKALWIIRTHGRQGTHHHYLMGFLVSKVFFKFFSKYFILHR